jgi:hypothetical protein
MFIGDIELRAYSETAQNSKSWAFTVRYVMIFLLNASFVLKGAGVSLSLIHGGVMCQRAYSFSNRPSLLLM